LKKHTSLQLLTYVAENFAFYCKLELAHCTTAQYQFFSLWNSLKQLCHNCIDRETLKRGSKYC